MSRPGTFRQPGWEGSPTNRDAAGPGRDAPIEIGGGADYGWRVAVVEAPAAVTAPRRSRTPLLGNLAFLAGSQAVTWCASVVWTVAVPRALGPHELGLYTFAVAAGGVLTVAIGLGLRPLLVREIAIHPERGPRLVGTSILLRVLMAVPALALVALVATVGPFGRGEAQALWLGFGLCFFYLLYEPIQAAFQAIERMRYLAYCDVITKAGVSIGAVVLVGVGVHALGLLVISVAVMALVFVLNLLWARGRVAIDWRTTRHELRRLVVDSLPYWSFAAFFTVYLWIDSLMLGTMTSSTVLGWYGMPTKLFGTLMFIPVILSTAWLPRLVAAHRDGDAALMRAARAPIEIVLVLSLPVCVGTALVAAPLVHALYGPGFDESVAILVILAMCVPPMYLNIMVNQVLVAMNRQKVWTKVMALASVLNPVLNFALIRYFQSSRGDGAIGSAIALLVTEVVIVGIGVAIVRRALDASVLTRVARAVVATALMAVAVVAVRHLGLIAQVAAGCLSFPVLMVLLRVLGDEERELLRQVTAAVRRRLRPRVATA